jgi:two-component system, NarL family, nitrate/nitrite response regulator NarL
MRVLIADYHPMFRLGLSTMLSHWHPSWTCQETSILQTCWAMLKAQLIDILIIEARQMSGTFPGHLAIFRSTELPLRIVAITEIDDTLGQLACRILGAHSTISRSDGPESVMRAVDALQLMPLTVDKGEVEPVRLAVSAMLPAERATLTELTSRQVEIMKLVSRGQSNKGIARDLKISPSAVKAHLGAIFRATGTHNRVEAAILAQSL